MGWKSTITISREMAINAIMSSLDKSPYRNMTNEELENMMYQLNIGDDIDKPYYGHNFIIDDNEYKYWILEYLSCESNERWVVIRTPNDWCSYDVKDNIRMGGCGDDVAEIKDITEAGGTDYDWDFSG